MPRGLWARWGARSWGASLSPLGWRPCLVAPKGPVRAGRGRALLRRAGVHGGVLCCSPLGEALEGEEKLARWRCERPFRVQRTGRRRWARARQVQGQVWRLGPGGSRTGQLGTVWACPSPAGSPCAGPARKPSGSSRTQARGPEPPEAFSLRPVAQVPSHMAPLQSRQALPASCTCHRTPGNEELGSGAS